MAHTVHLAPERSRPVLPPEPPPPAAAPGSPPAPSPGRRYGASPPSVAPLVFGPREIEPNRRRRIVRERDAIAHRLDLHGLDQAQARAALCDFLRRAQADGARAALVITGKGYTGDGVLRRRAPEWLAAPELRRIVAGVSLADRRHGGEGAFYVALKRAAH